MTAEATLDAPAHIVDVKKAAPGAPALGPTTFQILLPLLVLFAIFLPYRTLMARIDPAKRLLYPLSKELRDQPWKLLLPQDYFSGNRVRWTPTGYVVVGLLDRIMPATAIYITTLAVLMAVSYFLSWRVYHSRVFSTTLALCLGMGTQFDYTYVLNGCIVFVLLTLYTVVNLFFLERLIRSEAGSRAAKIGFLVSLVALALCFEQWLDYFAFLLLACGAGFAILCRHRGDRFAGQWKTLIFVSCSTVVVGATYLAIKWATIAEHLTPGHESDTIFTYKHRTLMVDDVISNLFTYIYIAFANFSPWTVSSISMDLYGAEVIVAEQHGYHAVMGALVPMHHQFLWYFAAGVVGCLFARGLARSLRAAWANPTGTSLAVAAILLLVLAGCATHCIIKYRPYMSSPVLAYKCVLGVLGVALLLSYGLMRFHQRTGTAISGRGLILAAWALLLVGTVTRPPQLSGMNERVGLSRFPDFRNALKQF
jgi:hypothetical protein